MRDEVGGQAVEQLGMGGRVGAVIQIERMNESAAHEQEPHAVDGVAGESTLGGVAAGQLARQQFSRLETRHARQAVRGR